jgi:hypothetical protein
LAWKNNVTRSLSELLGSSSFVLSGFAGCLDVGQETAPQPVAGRVAAGFYHFGPNCFHVRQRENSAYPSFAFHPLTMKFVVGAIGYDSEFEFSLTQKRLGKVTYVDGLAARDTGSIYQGIRSLIGNGYWNSDGLHFSLKGELDDTPLPYHPGPASKEYRWDKYEIAIHIPWEVLKYMFFQEVNFVIGNYERLRPRGRKPQFKLMGWMTPYGIRVPKWWLSKVTMNGSHPCKRLQRLGWIWPRAFFRSMASMTWARSCSRSRYQFIVGTQEASA